MWSDTKAGTIPVLVRVQMITLIVWDSMAVCEALL